MRLFKEGRKLPSWHFIRKDSGAGVFSDTQHFFGRLNTFFATLGDCF